MSRHLSFRTVVLAVLTAVVLALPALWTDFVFDDYFMIALIEDWYDVETPTCNLYSSFMDLPQMGWWRSEEPGGFGARESSLYLDPFWHPMEFLVGMTHHVPALLAAMWTGFPAMLWNAGLARPLEITGVIPTILVLAALRWLWPSLDAEDRRNVTWLGCGALMSLAPAALPQPMDRQLLVPMVGGAVVLATILVRGWERWRHDEAAGIGRWVAAAGVAGLALAHLVAAPALRVVQLQGFVAVNEASEGFADDLMRLLDDREVRGLDRPAATILRSLLIG